MITLAKSLSYINNRYHPDYEVKLIPYRMAGTTTYIFRATVTGMITYPYQVSGLGKSYAKALESVIERLKTYD